MRPNRNTARPIAALVPLAGLVLAACASTPTLTPQDAIGQANARLAQAQRHYTEDYAAPTLKQARKKITAAHKALADERPGQARDLAEEADLSVQLAIVQARAARNTANRKHVQRQVDKMKQLAIPPAGTATHTPGGLQ